MSGNPMTDIENEKAQVDIGTFASRIYRGARADGASRAEAFIVLVAWFKAMFLTDPTADET